MYRNDELATEGWGNSVIPCQYNDMVRRSTSLSGERRLLWAVLEHAIRCYLVDAGSASRARRLASAEARSWLFDRGADGPFTFEGVCDHLSIDAARLRKGLKSVRRTRQDTSAVRHLAA